MIKNARNVFSKKTLHTENHTKIVWQLPHTPGCNKPCQSKTCNTSQTLLRRSRTSHHCNPLHCTIAPQILAPLCPLRRAIVPFTLCHCTPCIVPLYSLYRTIGLPTPYHCTLYIVPLYPLLRTIVPPISYHCTPYIVPSHPIYRTIAPPLSHHCAPYMVPLHPLHHTIAPLHRTIVPLVLHLLCLVYLHHRTTALSSLHHRTCTSHPRTCASYPLKTIIVPTSRLPLRAVLLKFDNSKTSFFWNACEITKILYVDDFIL